MNGTGEQLNGGAPAGHPGIGPLPLVPLFGTGIPPPLVDVELEDEDELEDDYSFNPGQYLTLRTTMDGEEVRRSYSICSGPDDGELRIAVKKVEQALNI